MNISERYQTALLVLLISFTALFSMEQRADLPERYKQWLDKEAVYIITSVEREVFLKLQNDRERDLFVEAFWKQRDPTKGTPENEFKAEHYRRIAHADRYFGRDTFLPGWRTDRGRIYILLGEPKDIQKFDGKSQIYPAEVWFYQGLTDLGLPSGFNIVFYRRSGTGGYELYSPLNDGPMALLAGYSGDPMDFQAAYRMLLEAAPALAQVSLSLIPGEGGGLGGRPSMSSDLLIQRVEAAPRRQVENRYARKFLEYKDIVEVEYSTNYINSGAVVKMTRHPSGYCFVHYAVEPERLSVNQHQDKYYTTLRLNGTLTAEDGSLIYQFERDVNLELDAGQTQMISSRPVSIRDVFPVIPGRFHLSILMKNEISKEFTSVEEDLYIPGEDDGVFMTSPIVGYRINERRGEDRRVRPFQMGPYQVHVHSNRIFVGDDTLVLAFQLHGLTEDIRQKGKIRYRFLREDKEFLVFSKNLSGYSSPGEIVERIALEDFSPAHYFLEVALMLDESEVVQAREEFDLTFAEELARPWVYNKLLPDPGSPVYLQILGSQYASQGSLAKARSMLEEAYRKMPQSLEVSLPLAEVFMKSGEYASVEALLKPFVDREENPHFEAHSLLGEAYRKMGWWEKAAGVLELGLKRFGVSTLWLNALGDCYMNMEEFQKARDAWRRSLELDSGQPDIKKVLDRIKEKS